MDAAVILRLRGGLGNQLFEYAAARSLALRNHVPLLIDATSGFREDVYGRAYDLGAFKVIDQRIDSAGPLPISIGAELFHRFLLRREQLRVRYLSEYFDPAIYKLRIIRPVVFDWYCQSFRYFSDVEDVVRAEFEFKADPAGLGRAMVADIVQQNSVCLHIRRQLGKQADGTMPRAVADYYGTCDVAYYRRSIHHLAALHGRLQIFVFSDDLEWAKENVAAFQTDGGTVRIVDEADTLRSFYLMRLCKHFIIANSTFSWWAAWLGKDLKKTVCVPGVWNRGERRFPRNLFPSSWKVISSHATADDVDQEDADDASSGARKSHTRVAGSPASH